MVFIYKGITNIIKNKILILLMTDSISNIKILIKKEGVEIADELKKTLETEDDYLERFLEARNYDIWESLKMIKLHVEWYNNEILPIVDITGTHVLGCDPFHLRQHLPCWLHRYDKNNGPVLYSNWGNAKFHELLQKSEIKSLDHVLKYLVWINEQMIKILINQSKILNKKVSQWTFVINAEGWNISLMSKDSMEFVIKLAKISQNNYPGRMNHIFIINTPRVFSIFWSIFKNWLDPKTQERIYIITKKEIWLPILKKYINECDLPLDFGGSNLLIPLENKPIRICL